MGTLNKTLRIFKRDYKVLINTVYSARVVLFAYKIGGGVVWAIRNGWLLFNESAWIIFNVALTFIMNSIELFKVTLLY